jgi:hypothetical protein
MTDQLERAFTMLEACGIPRSRARTVHNGIQVLDTRYAKQVRDLREQITRLKAKVSADLVYETAMARIAQLMELDPAKNTPDGEELSVLADLAIFYERRKYPDLFPVQPK